MPGFKKLSDEREKYPVLDQKQSRSLCHFLGKGLPKFIGGRSEKGYYFNGNKYDEGDREFIRQCLEKTDIDKLPVL